MPIISFLSKYFLSLASEIPHSPDFPPQHPSLDSRCWQDPEIHPQLSSRPYLHSLRFTHFLYLSDSQFKSLVLRSHLFFWGCRHIPNCLQMSLLEDPVGNFTCPKHVHFSLLQLKSIPPNLPSRICDRNHHSPSCTRQIPCIYPWILSLSPHIQSICKSLCSTWKKEKKSLIWSFVPTSFLTVLVKVTIQYYLDSCSLFLTSIPASTLSSLRPESSL